MKHPIAPRITVFITFLAVVLAVSAACSGDDDDDGAGGASTRTQGLAETAPGNAVSPPPVVTGNAGGPEPGGRLAFYSFRDDDGDPNTSGDQEIYVMNVDGSDQVNISNNEADDFEPDWSPDGGRLAFVSLREGAAQIFVMDDDGENVQQLTTAGGGYLSPRWSPDGQSIALSRSGTLMLMDAGGANLRVLFEPQLEDVAEPCLGPGFPGGWSPDGKRITYYSASATRQTGEICTVDAATGDVEVIVREPVALHAEPVWSRDGRYLAYRSIRSGNSDVYTFDLEAGEETRLTDPDEVDAEPEWSPDGEWIAFVSYREYPNSDIYIMRKDGSDIRRLTTDPAKDTYPVWTP
ncbi:MAG: DPP IV N-terminal domain-containing protein [Dehalococcoidia bacterium]